MSLYANNVAAMVYTTLSGNITGSVYDAPPSLPEGAPDTNFPYTVIQTQARPWNTDDQVGEQHTVNLHTWSRYRGHKQAQTIQAEIAALLNRVSLSGTGIRVVDSLHEFSDVLDDPDGKTKHGVSRYLITVEGT